MFVFCTRGAAHVIALFSYLIPDALESAVPHAAPADVAA